MGFSGLPKLGLFYECVLVVYNSCFYHLVHNYVCCVYSECAFCRTNVTFIRLAFFFLFIIYFSSSSFHFFIELRESA